MILTLLLFAALIPISTIDFQAVTLLLPDDDSEKLKLILNPFSNMVRYFVQL